MGVMIAKIKPVNMKIFNRLGALVTYVLLE
jgi:hypothetical protein